MTSPHTGRPTTGRGWHGDLLDLDAYLERIGYAGERRPTREVLRALQRAHVTSIPFENFDVILGVPIPLDVESVQDKLVRRRRGGYCFEHVVLFAAALERLGFRFTGLLGRVTLGADKMLPATHALLAVEAEDDGRTWLCDVGFGSGPLEPIELADGVEADFEGRRFRVERRPGERGIDDWWLHERRSDGWLDRHTFTLAPHHTIDYVVGSHYVSTHPRSPFVRRPFAQRFTAERLLVLDAAAVTTVRTDGSRTERKVDADEFGACLAEEFGIILPPEDVARLADRLDAA
ncbi:arylamine N-acetyltransferase [Streptomyces mobaraensis NBRC 13819 = DSM 40847]|uniref:Putative Arylamine N-acetyltransferase n=1 Tax=Streptomyces mobaraensis (strain ATCC 29032 / DSM 40847 / JCM 4168 / NBRC 13819 / NCIMB 11159 / IPCR 16-22) TaxID=1223523 RepID=M3BKL1_STRM1|nr:arylamine N-acetyltransferase [Streptomyces mobaraensis]EMF00140.1 putative Arylamine N-acetyltransferase [Streptomyces mobaraensis NBRC 13819 = DSM 40847]QTT72510.1 arylamine N-acetyltransferase [Streptomyces mobaraensis NBRC 13819 = DSM 40847]